VRNFSGVHISFFLLAPKFVGLFSLGEGWRNVSRREIEIPSLFSAEIYIEWSHFSTPPPSPVL
jgi:hypothetical protein